MSQQFASNFEQSTGCTDIDCSDILIDYLEQLDIEYVFGIPGGAIEPLYNAIARSQQRGKIRSVVARHETGAAFMADGYARTSGRIGVCCATTGPGSTNLITGVASAYANNIPLLVITAQTSLENFGHGAFQESSCTGVNTVGMFQYCTRFNTLVSHPDQFEQKLVTALMHACHAPYGPVHLSVPMDVLRSPATSHHQPYNMRALLRQPSLVDEEALKELCRQLAQAKKIVFVIGEGCDEAIGTILELACFLSSSIVTTPHGKGLISAKHPFYRGVIGFAGHESAFNTLIDPEVDLVVAIGTGLSEWASGGWNTGALLNDRLIHVEASDHNLARSPMARLHVRGQLTTTFEHALKYIKDMPDAMYGDNVVSLRQYNNNEDNPFAHERTFSNEDENRAIKPQRLMHELARRFPPHTRYLADTGNSMAWAIHYLHPYDRRRAGKRESHGALFNTALEFASMGWAIGASIGIALARPNTPVVCITGDGSVLMSGQELTVAIQLELPVIFVVLNDAALGMVKHGQRMANAEPIGYELPAVDFSALARSMGAQAYTISTPKDFDNIDVNTICQHKGPTLLDVHIDAEEVPPIGVRIKHLEQTA